MIRLDTPLQRSLRNQGYRPVMQFTPIRHHRSPWSVGTIWKRGGHRLGVFINSLGRESVGMMDSQNMMRQFEAMGHRQCQRDKWKFHCRYHWALCGYSNARLAAARWEVTWT